MATIGKIEKPWTIPRGEGDDDAASSAGRVSESIHAGAVRVRSLGRNLPDQLETALKNEPAAVLAGVAAGGFILGALFGSKLGRIALTAALPYAIKEALEGTLGQKLVESARNLTAGPRGSS